MKSIKTQLSGMLGYLLVIHFDDPASVTGWMEMEEAVANGPDTACKATGFLTKVSQRYVRIHHIAGRDGQVADTLTIPKKVITKIEHAVAAKLWPSK